MRPLAEDRRTSSRLELNYRRNKEQDHTRLIDEAAAAFRYEDCKDAYWNPESHSLLYGTALWEQASPAQRVILNQLYWVAYYAQIISAEIATILLNQTSAAGLYTLEGFRLVCDTLDLETSQERAHINAFKSVGEATERALFGGRIFTYPMRSMYAATMIFADTDRLRDFWRSLQLRAFASLSSGNAFIGCQYFAVRGIRTLNGKMIQQALGRPFLDANEDPATPIPTKISHYHFMDESFHFNSSGIISHDVIRTLKPPTAFEAWVANRALAGCQRDHFHFSAAIRGIFWHDPALFGAIHRVLQAPCFGMEENESLEMLRLCFTEESDGIHESAKLHATAVESYKAYLAPLSYVSAENREMRIMSRSSIPLWLESNRKAFEAFRRSLN